MRTQIIATPLSGRLCILGLIAYLVGSFIGCTHEQGADSVEPGKKATSSPDQNGELTDTDMTEKGMMEKGMMEKGMMKKGMMEKGMMKNEMTEKEMTEKETQAKNPDTSSL